MANIRQNADGSAGLISETEGIEVFRTGGPKTPLPVTGNTHRAENVAKVTFGTGTLLALTGSLVSWQPPNNAEDVIVTRVVVVIQTTANATMDCGTAATGTTWTSNLIGGLSMGTGGAFDNITDKGSGGGKSRQYLTAGSFVVASPSATPSGLVGAMYITYEKV